jgi:START domain
MFLTLIGSVNAPCKDVFRAFEDTASAKEYNEHCSTITDVFTFPTTRLDRWTKISYAAGNKIGIFKARDFCSVVQFIKRPGGGSIILNRPAYYSHCAPSDSHVRATVLLGGNIIEPHGKHQTKLTLIAHVNPGGAADAPGVSMIVNKLCELGPPAFIRKLEKCVNKGTTRKSFMDVQ